MRSEELAYWDEVANVCFINGYTDNIWKRPLQLQRLLAHDWIYHRVLEIGTGNGRIAGSIAGLIGNNWTYLGTELSEKFRAFSKNTYGLNTVCADVLELPATDGGWQRIIALDSLEHVRPEDREAGYRKMAEIAADGALLFINYSNGVSLHNKQFDHPFGVADLVALESAGWRLKSFEEYVCRRKKLEMIPYVFAVMQRGKAGVIQ